MGATTRAKSTANAIRSLTGICATEKNGKIIKAPNIRVLTNNHWDHEAVVISINSSNDHPPDKNHVEDEIDSRVKFTIQSRSVGKTNPMMTAAAKSRGTIERL